MLSIQLIVLVAAASEIGKTLFISIIIGLAVAAVVVGGMIRQLKTVVPKKEANDYVKQGSLQLRISRDNFLYKKVERTARNKN